MSLKRKNDLAFKQILTDQDISVQILTGYQNQTVTKQSQRVIVNSIAGPPVTPRARNIIMRTEVLVETSADYQPGDDTTPEQSHAALVNQVHQALDNHPAGLASRLRDLGSDDPESEIGQYTCLGLTPLGELELPPKTQDRVLRDAWAYRVRCAEMLAT